MKFFVKKYSIVSFLILTYAISYISWFLPVIASFSTEIVYFLILLGMFGPMIAAFIIMTVQSGSRIYISNKAVFYSILISAFAVLSFRILVSSNESGNYYIEYIPYLKGLMPAFTDITWVGWALYLLLALITALGFSKVSDTHFRENFFRTLKFEPKYLGWYLFALLLFPLLFLTSYLLADLISIETSDATVINFPFYLIVIPFFSTFFFTGGNEEFGWRGFMQKELQKMTNPLLTSLVIAFFWALWHLPLHYNGLYSTGGFIDLLPRFIQAIPVTILFTWFYNRSEYSILILIILHTSINFSSGFISYSPVVMTVLAIILTLFFVFNSRMWKKQDYHNQFY